MINISKEILVGLLAANANRILAPAVVTPIGSTSSEKKKMHRIKTAYTGAMELQNTPLPGFTLTTCGRNSWGSSETIWNVIDPRGFTISISSSNLEKILHCTGITEGLIQERCVWARENENTTMILIPENAPEYKEAVSNTELLSNKVSKREVKIGDRVYLQSKLTGTYLGVYNFYSPSDLNLKEMNIKHGLYGRFSVMQIDPTTFLIMKDLKILKIEEESEIELPKEDALEIIRDGMKNGAAFCESTHLSRHARDYRYSRIKYIHTSSTVRSDMKFKLDEVDIVEAEELFLKGKKDFDMGVLLLEDEYSKLYLIDMPSSSYGDVRNPVLSTQFRVFEVSLSNDKILISPSNLTRSTWRQNSFEIPNIFKSLNDFKKYYKITKQIKQGSFV